jgi:hypothetical protein
MYASEPFFNFEPRRPVVPSWFKGLVVPLLLLIALPLSLLVLTVMLGMVGARVLLRLFAGNAAPVRPQQHRPNRPTRSGPTGSGSSQILTDVDYIVLDDEKR